MNAWTGCAITFAIMAHVNWVFVILAVLCGVSGILIELADRIHEARK